MKYNGPALYMYIAPSGVRIIEGVNKSGSIIVDKFFKVIGVDKYFERNKNGDGQYEIINVSGLVTDIISECKNRRTKSRKVFIVSNCCGIETVFSSEQSKGSLKSLLTADIGGGKKQKDKSKETKNKQIPGKMQSKTMWGDTIIDGRIMKYSTTSVGDKYFLKTLVTEFYNNNYEVFAISDAVSQLINLKQTHKATFDNQGKIIIDIDSVINILTMVRDIPIEYSSQPFTNNIDINKKIFNIIKSQMITTGRNPIIYLTGEYFDSFKKYHILTTYLESQGLEVYNIFEDNKNTGDYDDANINTDAEPVLNNESVEVPRGQTENEIQEIEYEQNSIRGEIEDYQNAEDTFRSDAGSEVIDDNIQEQNSNISSSAEQDDSFVEYKEEEEEKREEGEEFENLITPDYSICFACLLTAFSKQSVNVVPPIGFDEVLKKNSNIIAKGIIIASASVFMFSVSSACLRFMQMLSADRNPSMISTYDAKIQELKMNKTKLDETMQTLTQADVMILDVMSFINSNQSDFVKVISIDTTDMLTTEVEVTENDVVTTEEVADKAEDVIEGVSQELKGGRAPIIIRGYAKTGNAAIDYYNKLFKHGLAQDPVLNGVEKYMLPTGQEVYIFEIQIGGDI